MKRSESRAILQIPYEPKKTGGWYIGAATFWLVLGTLIGSIFRMKMACGLTRSGILFVFWQTKTSSYQHCVLGLGTLAMIGLGYFVIAKNNPITKIYNYKNRMATWILIKSHLGGRENIFLNVWINNGGGEYPRVYLARWCSCLPQGWILTFYNFSRLFSFEKIEEIYISNWYIMVRNNCWQ